MNFRKKVYQFLIVLAAVFITSGCTLSKAFEALDVYNYFQAKKHFEKAEKRHPVIAKYGLSIIQQRSDNPFFNIDTAYTNITYAVTYYDSLPLKTKEKYSEFGVTDKKLLNQQKLIADDMFTRAVTVNTEEAFQTFIDENYQSILVPKAVFYRDSLFYNETIHKNTAADFKYFTEKYPHSFYFQDAFARYERTLYAEETAGDDLNSYIKFLKEYPQNPFAADAENKIYEIETKAAEVANYELFIKRHPNNRNIRDAWSKLYDAYLTENLSNSAIAEFIEAYPNNPFKESIESDLARSKTIFYPVQKNGEWSFIGEFGKYKIARSFDYVEPFNEGLAMVVKDNKVGFVTKAGDLKIDYKFNDALPFSEGTAVVEVDEKYGLINRRGDFIVLPEFEYLGQMINGLIPFEQNGKYGYLDKKGKIKIEAVFDYAYNFEGGIATVSLNDKWGIINTKGTYVFDPSYEAINVLSDSVFAFFDGSHWGAFNLSKDTVLQFFYDDISEASESYYLVTKQDSFNYVNSLGQYLLEELWQPVYPEYKILAKYNKRPILILTEDGYNYLQLNGKMVFKKGKQKLGQFSSIIAFEKEGLWGYLSPYPPKEIIKPQFDKAQSFQNGFGIVSLFPLVGLLDGGGNYAIEAYYEELAFLTKDILIAKGKGDYGLISTVGDTILPFSSQEIEPFAKNIVKLSGPGNVSYYNYISKTWIRKED